MDMDTTSRRPACESPVERQMHAPTDTAPIFNQSVSSSLDTILESTCVSALETIFESTTESFTRLYDDFDTTARNSWDGVSRVYYYDRCCRQRNLKQAGCCSFSCDPGSRFGLIATTRGSKQRKRSPISRRRLGTIMRISLGADSAKPPNSPAASRISPESSTSSSISSSSNQQDRWQSVVRTSAEKQKRLDSPLKKEGIQSASVTVKSLPREKEMKKYEEAPPTIEKLLEQKWERERQEEEMSKSLPREKEMKECEEGPPTMKKLLEQKLQRELQEERMLDLLAGPDGAPIHMSTVIARGA